LAKCCCAVSRERKDLSCRVFGLTQCPLLLSRGLNLLSIGERVYLQTLALVEGPVLRPTG